MNSLPPTFEAFLLHVLLAPFQICIWKAALTPDPTEYGGKYLHHDQTLHHVPLPMNTPPQSADMMFATLRLLYGTSLCFPQMHMQQIRDNIQNFLQVF